MIARFKDKLRALTREAIADVLALEAERDALRARAEKAEREADRYKHDATKAAAERDAWRSRALKAEAHRTPAEPEPKPKPKPKPEPPTEAEADAAVRAAYSRPKPEPKPEPPTEPKPEPKPEPSARVRRPDLRDTPTLRVPAPAAREEQRRREIRATRATDCPTCNASAGEDCEEGDRKGPFHADRWTEGKRRLALADGALAIECPDCKAEPGAWCVVDGRKGLHKSRENESKKE